jgi:hypothetical protein
VAYLYDEKVISTVRPPTLWIITGSYGTVSRDGYFFFEGLEHFKQYFLCIADGFQELSKAFHYPIQLLTLICFFEITYCNFENAY